jgi:hypothetical protein
MMTQSAQRTRARAVAIVIIVLALGVVIGDTWHAAWSRGSLTPEWFNEFLQATAVIVGAVAWPAVALVLAWRHRPRIDELLGRIREAAGTKFDPLPVQFSAPATNPVQDLQTLVPPAQAVVAPGAPAGAQTPTRPPEIERLRTETVRDMERIIVESPAISTTQNTEAKASALLTLAAAATVMSSFERIESLIWGSQITLLEFLNMAANGAPRDHLKTAFYDSAVKRFPDVLKNQDFDAYLTFLRSWDLIAEDQNGIVGITPRGKDYLIWRLRQGRVPRLVG